jgi:hypothetical protein
MLCRLSPATLESLFFATTGAPIPAHWTHARAATHLTRHPWRALRTIAATVTLWRQGSKAPWRYGALPS